MEGGKEYFLKMRQEVFEQELTHLQRSMFHYCELQEENEYETHKDDPIYKKLYKAKRNAIKELKEYLFKKRHA